MTDVRPPCISEALPTGFSRRRALRAGALAVGTAALGAAWPSAAAAADPTDAGADGAPGDSGGNHPALISPAVSGTTSYNGWPVGYPASTIGVVTYTVPGSTATLAVKSGDVATVLIGFAQRFNSSVERLEPEYTEGYQYRANVNNPSVWSNHASGTAIDLNFNWHPNGSAGTFSASQRSAIRSLLNSTNGVVYWGGDYSGTVDEMHFEINVGPGDSRLTALASSWRGGSSPAPQHGTTFRSMANRRLVCADNAGRSPLIANRTSWGAWELFDMVKVSSTDVGLRSHANGLYVCADNAGASALIANRKTRGLWETFQLLRNSDGTYSLRARANGKFVCAEGGGAYSLRANRTAIGLWEKFQLDVR